MLLFVICAMGTLLVAYARAERSEAISNAEPPKVSDHWHAAYGVYVCDHFLPPFPAEPQGQDKLGIHTHGDGVMHIHPFGSGGAGFNARLGVWAKTVGMKLGDQSFSGPDGTEYTNGYDCNGQPANVYVYRWANAFDPRATAEVFASGFPDIRYRNDRSAFTFAVVPPDKVNAVPKPDSVATLNNLSDVDQSQQGATTSSPPTDLSIPDIPGDSTTSSPPADASVPEGAPPVETGSQDGASVSSEVTPSSDAPTSVPAP
ncbi:MAG: hypothetical protein N2037_10795 [Acidimicrobiales bacterium]|nr:hypothetical protein [Acidimicrobiales bacterium]